MRQKGLIDLYILEILERYSGSRRRLSQQQILAYLEDEYRLSVTRKTLAGYLRQLRDEGYIEGLRGWYRAGRFTDGELRVLIDGVFFGQHIPRRDAEALISKLKSLSGHDLKNRIRHVCYLENMNHTPNDRLYEIVDSIDEAIERNKKAELTICAYHVDGNLHDTKKIIVDPYYLVTEKNHYYLICYAGRNQDLENRRVDRISKVEVLNETRRPLADIEKYAKGFDLAAYMREHIYMFSGDTRYVTIRLKKTGIGDFIDWYGPDFRVLDQQEDHYTLKIRVNENAVYYWALQYGGIAEVLAPEPLRRRIREGLEQMLEKYK